MKLSVPALLLSFACAGCMTTQTSDVMKDILSDGGARQKMTVEVRNTGWFLFDCIPLICGDPEAPDEVATRLFTDTLTLQSNLDVLGKIVAKNDGYRLGSVTSHEEGEGFLVFIVTRRSCHTAATLMRPEPDGTAERNAARIVTGSPAGATGCEGRNRFSDLTLRSGSGPRDPRADGEH